MIMSEIQSSLKEDCGYLHMWKGVKGVGLGRLELELQNCQKFTFFPSL